MYWLLNYRAQRNQSVMALEIFPDPILALQTQLTMPIFVYKYFKLNLLVSNIIILSSRPWLLRSQVPRSRDKSLFIYLAVKYSVVTRYNQTSRHIKFHSTKLEFHGQIATMFLLHCPRELANNVYLPSLSSFIKNNKIFYNFDYRFT